MLLTNSHNYGADADAVLLTNSHNYVVLMQMLCYSQPLICRVEADDVLLQNSHMLC